MANSIQRENVYRVGFQSPCMFCHVMGVQIMDNNIYINYWRHVFIKASIFCKNLCHLMFGILTWLHIVDSKRHVFTRGQLWPSGIVVACVCLCVCVYVCVCVRQ